MQVGRLHIQNFKGIDDLDISFLKEGTDEPRPVTLLLGDNGCGKTTVLQALALVLSLATRKSPSPAGFHWPGFLVDRVSSRGPTRVELEVVFNEDELAGTQELLRLSAKRKGEPFELDRSPPRKATLVYQDGGIFRQDPEFEPRGEAGMKRFWGRHMIQELIKTQPSLSSLFRRIGDVFWFDQNRNVLSLQKLREEMITLWAAHTSIRRSPMPDYLGQVQERFAELFPGTHFVGVEPRNNSGALSGSDAYFLLERDGRVYDIAEMSSGEQAVFPLLYEFVRLSIARSVVLIDELELHLHPPQQQALMAALRRIGPDCQFIVTSHSPYLEQVTPDEDEIRLSGGQRCL